MIISAQCRAGRALIPGSRENLAKVSRVSIRTMVDFERGARSPRDVTLLAIERALAEAGVTLIDDERSEGVVKLRGRQP